MHYIRQSNTTVSLSAQWEGTFHEPLGFYSQQRVMGEVGWDPYAALHMKQIKGSEHNIWSTRHTWHYGGCERSAEMSAALTQNTQ